jgi:hypothetical protein
MTLRDQADLIVRQKDSYDGAVPSGTSVATMALLRLSALLDRKDYYDLAQKAIAALARNTTRAPQAYMNLLNAFDFSYYRPKELALIGSLKDMGLQQFVKAIHSEYLPNKIIAVLDPADPNQKELSTLVPLLQSRTELDHKSTAYVCKNFICKLPVNAVEAFRKQLKEE